MRGAQPIDNSDASVRHRQAEGRTEHGEHGCLGDKLRRHPSAASAQCSPNCNLGVAGTAAGEHQIEEIHATDDEYERNGAREHT
jgi:hypothetical protein